MQFDFLPQPNISLRDEYKKSCSYHNLKYVRFFSYLTLAVFGFHLLHHFRFGMQSFSPEFMPYTLIYTFAILYASVNLVILRGLSNVPALTPVIVIVELVFPIYMALLSVVLSVLGATSSQGITPFAVMMMIVCFLLQGRLIYLIALVIGAWATLSVSLLTYMSVDDASPHVAIGLSSGVACIVISYITEKMRIRQFETITQLNKRNEQLHLLSSQDHLTGLLNRRSTDEILAREMTRSDRFDHPLSLLLIDIDGFKEINDSFGHNEGDEAIKMIADSIRKHVRDVDYVGRLGGDEFIVLLIETDKNLALQIADRMRIEVSRLPKVQDQFILTVSIGHTQYSGESLSAMIEKADKALYSAKKAGKNRVRSTAVGME